MQFLNIITLVAVATRISAHPVELSSKVADSPVHASTDYGTTGADGLGPNMEVRDVIDRKPGIKAKSEVAVIDVADQKPENQAGGGSHVQARHEGGFGWKNDHEGGAYVYPSSRVSRGEHNTVADDWKYKDNLEKLENGNCGIGCHNSLNSYSSVASHDAKVARAAHYGGEYEHEGGGGYHGGGYGGGYHGGGGGGGGYGGYHHG
ncbi:hypothetical protein LZ30DRAFT_767105 [Colletotrichum cereale]|nr:hypothetical protein LZ30DRAFT_767105 [Colletotrichum cereale]